MDVVSPVPACGASFPTTMNPQDASRLNHGSYLNAGVPLALTTNYQSKEDILKEESDRLIKEWGRLYESNPESAPETLFPSLFDFYRDHRDFYSTLYNAGMSSIMMETIIGTIQITPEMQNLEAYMKSFWAYGIYGWLIEWIKRGMPESGKELSSLFSLAHLN